MKNATSLNAEINETVCLEKKSRNRDGRDVSWFAFLVAPAFLLRFFVKNFETNSEAQSYHTQLVPI